MNKKKLNQLLDELNECYEQASKLQKLINKEKFSDLTDFEGKFLFKKEGLGRDYLFVERCSIDEDSSKICLSGMNFYINDDKEDKYSAEVYFKGWQNWWLDLDEALSLRNIQILDKETFMNEIKGYTKNLEIFINEWIEKKINK